MCFLLWFLFLLLPPAPLPWSWFWAELGLSWGGAGRAGWGGAGVRPKSGMTMFSPPMLMVTGACTGAASVTPEAAGEAAPGLRLGSMLSLVRRLAVLSFFTFSCESEAWRSPSSV